MNSEIKSLMETSPDVRDFELLNLGVLVKVQNSEALYDNLNSIVCSESSVAYLVEGSEPLDEVEVVIEDFMTRLASDIGCAVDLDVNVKGRLVTVTWSIEII